LVGCDWEAKWVAGEAAEEVREEGLAAPVALAAVLVDVVGSVAPGVLQEVEVDEVGEEEKEGWAAEKVLAAEARSEPSIPQWHRLLEWTRLR